MTQHRVWVYGDNVNTDVIFPGKYTYTLKTNEEIAAHVLEDLDPTFKDYVRPGDVVIGVIHPRRGNLTGPSLPPRRLPRAARPRTVAGRQRFHQPIAKVHDALCILGHIRFMGDHQYGDPGAIELRQQLHDFDRAL